MNFAHCLSLIACSVCFSPVGNDPMAVALRASIATLLVVTVSVLAVFAKFFWGIRRRERTASKEREK